MVTRLLYTTVTPVRIGEHQVSFWSDGHMEIENEGRDFVDAQDRDQLDHACLDELEQYRLYCILHAKFKMKECSHE
jgi:hypothetical protein